jgi:hypothetical protein
MKKTYRISETQFAAILSKKQKDKQSNESANMNEADASNNVFRNELKSSSDIDLDIDMEVLFKNIAKPGTRGTTVIVDGVEYDPYISINSAIATYTIDIEYRSYGIKDVYLSPVSVLISGSLELTGDDDSFDKDFELEFDRTGLKSNTLSGTMNLGGKSIEIAPLRTNVTFESNRNYDKGDSFYVQAITCDLAAKESNKIIFEY